MFVALNCETASSMRKDDARDDARLAQLDHLELLRVRELAIDVEQLDRDRAAAARVPQVVVEGRAEAERHRRAEAAEQCSSGEGLSHQFESVLNMVNALV